MTLPKDTEEILENIWFPKPETKESLREQLTHGFLDGENLGDYLDRRWPKWSWLYNIPRAFIIGLPVLVIYLAILIFIAYVITLL